MPTDNDMRMMLGTTEGHEAPATLPLAELQRTEAWRDRSGASAIRQGQGHDEAERHAHVPVRAMFQGRVESLPRFGQQWREGVHGTEPSPGSGEQRLLHAGGHREARRICEASRHQDHPGV